MRRSKKQPRGLAAPRRLISPDNSSAEDVGEVDFGPFFNPRSVAIVGASRQAGKPGYVVLENLSSNGYQGEVFPVNPKATEIMGRRAYPSVKEIPAIPDVAVLIVPARATLEALNDCVEKGVKAVVVESGGFTEVGEEGLRMEREMVEIAKRSGVRIVGPNTSGLISTPGRFITTFYPLGKVRPGPVAYLAQTGNFATHTMRWILSAEHYGVSRVVGLGNKCDVDDADVLEYLGSDPETRVICMYLEGFKDGRRFMQVAKRVTRKKPVIALMGGVTAKGTRAVMSHTASLGASNPQLVEGVFHQAGVVRVQRYTELIDSAKALAFQPLPRGGRVGLIVPSGGMGVLAADACVREGLEVANLSARTLERLQRISQPWIKIGNPVDIWSAIQSLSLEEGYRTAMETVLRDPAVDSLITILVLTTDNSSPNLDFIPELSQRYPGKPILIGISGDKESFDRAKEALESRQIPVYLPVEGACEALGTMYRCSRVVRVKGSR